MASEAEARMKERDDARKAVIEKRRQERDEKSSEQETQDHFMFQFAQQKENIEELLASLSKETAKDTFEELSTKMNSLKKFLSDSTVFLPKFAVKTAQEKVNVLQDEMNGRKEELLPKQKFAFKSRTKKSATPSSTSDSTEKPVAVPVVGQNTQINNGATSSTIEVKDKVNDNIILESDTITGCDISLSNLTSTTVKVIGSPGTLHITNCTRCKIFSGPVQRSIFIDNCTDTLFTIACQQLRIHTTKTSVLYIHVTSRVIIEDSTGLQFAPYNWTYPQLDEHFTLSGLTSHVNNWDKIDDFNWLTSKEHSPNWSLIPSSERQLNDS